MKRLSGLVLAIGLAAPLLAGCGSAPSTGNDAEAERTMAETMAADTMADAPVDSGAAATSP